ncbi:hypothetical protein B0H15DRAFT_781299, partial [Mycena belliarum]
DANTICPLCDSPLPLQLSEILARRLDDAITTGTPDPRPGNCLGLVATTQACALVCTRHRFETDLIPKALHSGWKLRVDFKDVERRLKHMKPIFDALIEDYNNAADGPRQRSVFWQKAHKNAVENSSKSQGIAGDLMSFKNVQPGYYGEQGIYVMNETFRRLFSIHPDSTYPLTPEQFAAFVLTPEAGVSLIMEDLEVTREKAIETMYESSSYGVQMFPFDDI